VLTAKLRKAAERLNTPRVCDDSSGSLALPVTADWHTAEAAYKAAPSIISENEWTTTPPPTPKASPR
jgi:hypothetical protein